MAFLNIYISTAITVMKESFVHVTNEDGLTYARLLNTCNCWSIRRLGELRLRDERFLVDLED